MRVEVVAESGGGDDGCVFLLGGEADESVVNLLIDDGALRDPSDLTLVSLDVEEAAVMGEDKKALSVFDFSDAIGDGGDAVAEKHLAGPDVNVLGVLDAEAGTAGEQNDGQKQEDREPM
ncbi:MAG TPA: hypothetical protein VLT57_01410 [Bryobacteraceae bacterium]|nr:hypothetical protein [Bryobacteraceae bacterium]